jgi:hypothetical protein
MARGVALLTGARGDGRALVVYGGSVLLELVDVAWSEAVQASDHDDVEQAAAH